jgi:hypothetical protein
MRQDHFARLLGATPVYFRLGDTEHLSAQSLAGFCHSRVPINIIQIAIPQLSM